MANATEKEVNVIVRLKDQFTVNAEKIAIKQKALKEGNVEGSKAVDQMVSSLEKQKTKLTDQIKAYESYIAQNKNLITAQNGASQAAEKLASQQQKLSTSTGGANSQLTAMGRIIQDAPYGLNAISNNISNTIEQMGYLVKSTGSVGGAMSALASTLFSPTGILIGLAALPGIIQLVSSWFREGEKEVSKYQESFEKLLESTKKITKYTIDDYSKAIDIAKGKIKENVQTVNDLARREGEYSNISEKDRLKRIESVNEETRRYKALIVTFQEQLKVTQDLAEAERILQSVGGKEVTKEEKQRIQDPEKDFNIITARQLSILEGQLEKQKDQYAKDERRRNEQVIEFRMKGTARIYQNEVDKINDATRAELIAQQQLEAEEIKANERAKRRGIDAYVSPLSRAILEGKRLDESLSLAAENFKAKLLEAVLNKLFMAAIDKVSSLLGGGGGIFSIFKESGGYIPARESGGFVPQFAESGGSRGGLVTVGERGQETVRLPMGSQVYSSGETREMGKSLSVVLNFGDDMLGVVKGLKREMRQAGVSDVNILIAGVNA